MTQVARAQLKKLVDERKVKRDAKPRDVENYSCNVVTERSKKAEIGEKIVARKLAGKLLGRTCS